MMFVWVWAMATVMMPAQWIALSGQMVAAQHATVETVTEAVSRPPMALGWVEEDEAPIF